MDTITGLSGNVPAYSSGQLTFYGLMVPLPMAVSIPVLHSNHKSLNKITHQSTSFIHLPPLF
jgi:hypothetical protein